MATCRKSAKRKRDEDDVDELQDDEELDELADDRIHEPDLRNPLFPLDPTLGALPIGYRDAAHLKQQASDRLSFETQERDYALQNDIDRSMVGLADIIRADHPPLPRHPLDDSPIEATTGHDEFGEKSSFWEQEALEQELQASLTKSLGGST